MHAPYEDLKRQARDENATVRAGVASSPHAPPELLYFLSQDPDSGVRRAAAENPALPNQANMLLARDADHGVRVALAYKIAGAGLSSDERSNMLRMGLTILETLATDKIVRVRAALAQALSKVAEAPRPLIRRLASDGEEEVATPVLEHSPVLTEDDLKDLLSGNPPDWLIAAIGRREFLPGAVVDLIIDDHATRPTHTRPIVDLVENSKSTISAVAMTRIVEAAADVEAWHEPLVRRQDVAEPMLIKLAKWVSGPLLKILLGRKDLGPEVRRAISDIAESRGFPGSAGGIGIGTATGAKVAGDATGADKSANGVERALELARAGRLDGEALALALDRNDNRFVIAGLAMRAGLSVDAAERIIKAANARVVTALVWKAQMPMRFALDVQRFLARVPGPQQLNARNGVDFPLSEDEMAMLVETFS